MKDRRLDGVWEVSGTTLARKISPKLSWLIFANLGLASDRPTSRPNGPGWPSWTQDGAQVVQVGFKMAILTPFRELC